MKERDDAKHKNKLTYW